MRSSTPSKWVALASRWSVGPSASPPTATPPSAVPLRPLPERSVRPFTLPSVHKSDGPSASAAATYVSTEGAGGSGGTSSLSARPPGLVHVNRTPGGRTARPVDTRARKVRVGSGVGGRGWSPNTLSQPAKPRSSTSASTNGGTRRRRESGISTPPTQPPPSTAVKPGEGSDGHAHRDDRTSRQHERARDDHVHAGAARAPAGPGRLEH